MPALLSTLAAGVLAFVGLGIDDHRDEQQMRAREARRREIADRLALLVAAGPADCDPFDYAAGADRLVAAKHGRHRRTAGGDR